MIDPRDVFFDTLNIDSCRIITSKSPIILLCGGKAIEKERADDPLPDVVSLRQAIINKTPDIELYRPEQITSWHEDAVFKNLVQFEEQLAAVCSIVVLIIESPGSIAELGAFSQQAELQEKLMVVKSSFFTKPSFIELGILRYIRESRNSIFSSPIKSYPWDIDTPKEIDDDMVNDVITSIKEGLKFVPASEALSDSRSSHTTTIIRELIRLFIALKKSEITKYLDRLNIHVSVDQLNRKLFLLEKFQLIKSVDYESTYYCCTSIDYNTLRLSAIKGKRLDAISISIDCQKYYEHKKDRHRLGAIKEFRKGRVV